MSSSLWHGLTDSQVLAFWDRREWRPKLFDVLEHIANDPKAAGEQRLKALVLLNTGMLYKLLPEGHVDYPALSIKVLVAVSTGEDFASAGFWSWRTRRLRAKYAEQLNGAQHLIQTASQFVPTEDLLASGIVGEEWRTKATGKEN